MGLIEWVIFATTAIVCLAAITAATSIVVAERGNRRPIFERTATAIRQGAQFPAAVRVVLVAINRLDERLDIHTIEITWPDDAEIGEFVSVQDQFGLDGVYQRVGRTSVRCGVTVKGHSEESIWIGVIPPADWPGGDIALRVVYSSRAGTLRRKSQIIIVRPETWPPKPPPFGETPRLAPNGHHASSLGGV